MKRFLAGSLAGVTALAVTAGCANQFQQLEPKLELRQAAQELGATGKSGFTIKAGGNVDDLIALAKKDDSTFKEEDADILRKLYNSSFTVAWDKAGEGVADDKALINATIDGVTGAEVRVVDQVAYVKVPVNELVTKFGGKQSDVDELSTEMGNAIPGIDALIAGSWVSVDSKDLTKLAQGTTGVAPSADPAQNDAIAAELKTSAENLLEGATIVRDEKDKTHLVATTTTVKAFTEAKRFVEAAAKLAGEGTGDLLNESLGSELEKPPADKPIVLDLWVDNGKFKAFEVNFLQFVEGNTGRATLRVEIADGADIAVPDNVTKLDVTKIFEAINGAAGAGAPTGLGGGDAKTWAELIGSQATLKALSEGGKPAAHLKDAAADMTIPGVTVKVVGGGKAQVTSGSSVVCLTVPATTSGKSKVAEGAC
ncbi:hypothetical protein [Actinoplanes derwentensis]|uniref:Lipoprotein n=1 Tax=Actinoplanes derwentensis TaxID=113562 RepID=A0A1H1ZGB1_9ACTN|nr:hypothetical protein [Actinoplanes derwentensis]GID82421.1 hypothetical protein Ade03nite_13450 [Actinoplanes derwentensis]SDT32607.1 hypothetical protein SAMN04489716_3303 [Actinoplanes derwentensis]